ncbi:zf-HC2 domain-containing protein [Streptomyces zingiberis]|uniref:Zf-HC2 domain-containing protein n=1 Tax=Streptomyces zingiberis TaxID=2053010 RepID=A0ABX1BV90_9ACTN|nr:zf-HC2 domain-containing protein [Streptomyces zingiberis]NJQ00983.1 zf-HC2 domain-containing protein [Streptomyces zingiberis]
MTGSGGASPAEQHLGDRLAALVDGELGHETRERVLAHLATCHRCRDEADAQRRLKSVFAEAAPPPPPAALLARLQGLPADGGREDGPGPHDRAGSPGGRGQGARRPIPVEWLPGRAEEADAVVAAVSGSRQSGFRIHEMGRRPSPAVTAAPGPHAAPQRSRRFAFAAAGAVSLAAFALGATLPLEAAVEGPRTPENTAGRPGGSGSGGEILTAYAVRDGRAGETGTVAPPAVAGRPASPGPGATAHPQQPPSPQLPLLPADFVLGPLIRSVADASVRGGALTVPPAGEPSSPAPTALTAPSAPADTANPPAPLAGGSTGSAFLPPAAR